MLALILETRSNLRRYNLVATCNNTSQHWDNTMIKLTIAEYGRKFGVADSTIRHRIKSGKLDAETIEGILHVVIDDNDIGTTVGITPEIKNQHLIASLQQQVEHLQQTCDNLRQDCDEKSKRIEELHQLMAISQTNMKNLIGQNQLLLEETKQKSVWQRLKMLVSS